MNWGHKILIAIILFVLTMTGMVFVAARQTNEMVDHHYYAQELKYQEVINGQKNLVAYSTSSLLSQQHDSVMLMLPVGTFEHFESGTMEWIKPDMATKDVMLDFTPKVRGQVIMPLTHFSTGVYTVRIHWRNGGVEFYRQESILLRAQQ